MINPRDIKPDPVLDERALFIEVQRLGMRVWRDPREPGQGHVFCPKCGFGSGVRIVLSRWTAAPLGCYRFGDKSCDGRPFE